MVLEAAYAVLRLLGFGLLDWIFFMVIDNVVKLSLRKNVFSREILWASESLVFATVAYYLQYSTTIVKHTPYLLYIAALLEFGITLYSSRFYARNLLSFIGNRWEEYEQHEESRENQQRLFEATRHTQTLNQTPTIQRSINCSEVPLLNQQKSQYSYSPKSNFAMQAGFDFSVRRPLQNETSFVSVRNLQENNFPPPGICNSGNMCFLNSIVQILAHTPKLVENLSRTNDSGSNFLKSFKEACFQLRYNRSAKSYVDLNQLKNFIRYKDPSKEFLNSDSINQEQHDASELFLWLLDSLHTDLLSTDNTLNGALSGRQPQNSLEALRFIYGDMTLKDMEEVRDTSYHEIGKSRNIESDAFVEAVQRLSDIEWLAYKSKNCTAIDELFTGQQLFISQCAKCYKPSVKVQPFRVLMLPVSECQISHISGVLHLNDCFQKFAASESVHDAVSCKSCMNPNMNGVESAGTSTPIYRRRLPTDASPILSWNDERVSTEEGTTPFKTSTPVRGLSSSDYFLRAYLRQLPPCIAIQLLRYRCTDEHICRKIDTPINIPLKNLNLTKLLIGSFTLSPKIETAFPSAIDLLYDLYAVCVHFGLNCNSGHYVTYALGPDELWYKFDDDKVTRITGMDYELTKRQIKENVYLLFYKRRIC